MAEPPRTMPTPSGRPYPGSPPTRFNTRQPPTSSSTSTALQANQGQSTADTTSSVIVAGARTPMGRLLGSLKDLSGSDLGAIAIRGALAKAGVGPELVQSVSMGQVRTAGGGQNPATQSG